MSIITSALRKAQEKRLHNQPELRPTTQTSVSLASSIVEPSKNINIKNTPHEIARPKRFFSILLLLIAIFGGIAGILLYINCSSIVAAPKKAATAPLSTPQPVAREPEVAIQKPILQETKPAPQNFTIPKELPTLSGIMYSPTSHQAILNGKAVSEGTSIPGFTVKKIYPNSVLLVRNGDSKEFELNIR